MVSGVITWVRQKTQENANWHQNTQDSPQNVKLGNLVGWVVILLGANNFICFLKVAICKPCGIKLNYLLLKVLNLLLAIIKVTAKLFCFYQQRLLDDVVGNVQIILSHSQ